MNQNESACLKVYVMHLLDVNCPSLIVNYSNENEKLGNSDASCGFTTPNPASFYLCLLLIYLLFSASPEPILVDDNVIVKSSAN